MPECGHDVCTIQTCAMASVSNVRTNAQKVCPVYERISMYYPAQVLAEV
mgnify:CR=1 FL=1